MDNGSFDIKCPYCDYRYASLPDHRYCPKCGQKVDCYGRKWGKE